MDTLILIGLNLDDKDLLKLCLTNKKFYRKIYKENTIWLIKLKNYDTTFFTNLSLSPIKLYKLIKILTAVKDFYNIKSSLWEIYNATYLHLTIKDIIDDFLNYYSNPSYVLEYNSNRRYRLKEEYLIKELFLLPNWKTLHFWIHGKMITRHRKI